MNPKWFFFHVATINSSIKSKHIANNKLIRHVYEKKRLLKNNQKDELIWQSDNSPFHTKRCAVKFPKTGSTRYNLPMNSLTISSKWQEFHLDAKSFIFLQRPPNWRSNGWHACPTYLQFKQQNKFRTQVIAEAASNATILVFCSTTYRHLIRSLSPMQKWYWLLDQCIKYRTTGVRIATPRT